jgi:hypothetical protein
MKINVWISSPIANSLCRRNSRDRDGADMNRTKWLALIAGLLALLVAGRMGLRYLDWQASEQARAATAEP